MKDRLTKLGFDEQTIEKIISNLGTILDGDYVSKTRFNEVNEELKTAKTTITERDTQIKNLGNSAQDIEALKKEKEDLIKANKKAMDDIQAQLLAERKSNAIKLELGNEVHNSNIVMGLLKLDDIIMSEDGKVKSGLKEQLDELKKSDSYLFKSENNNSSNPNVVIKGATPKDGDKVPASNLSKAELFAMDLAKSANEANKIASDNTYFK